MTTTGFLDPVPAIALARQAVTNPSQWTPFLQEVARTCNADQGGALFIPRPCPDGRHLIAVDGALVDGGVAYFSHWIKEDPWLSAARRQGTNLFTRAGEVRFGRDFLPDDELRRTAFYNDFGRHFGAGQKISLMVCDHDDHMSPAVTLSVNRSFGRAPLGPAEQTYLRALWQPLQEAMRQRWRLRHMKNSEQGGLLALNNLPYPTLVLRVDASVNFVNDQAQQLMRSVPWFKVAGDRVCQVGDADLSEFAAAVWAAPSGTARTWVFGYGEDGAYRCGTLRLISVAPESSFAACWPHAHALLFIDLPAESALESRVNRFAWRHKLTPQEHKILALAVGRERLPQIASHLGIAKGTVRVNLSNIYGKTNTKSLADLVRLVMT